MIFCIIQGKKYTVYSLENVVKKDNYSKHAVMKKSSPYSCDDKPQVTFGGFTGEYGIAK